MANSREVLLVGSIPLQQPETVMSTAAERVGGPLKRIPDGETGARSKFITWQEKVLAQADQLDVTPLGPQAEWGPNGELPPRTVRLRPGAKGSPSFPRTGYAGVALDSYRIFSKLKSDGKIVKDVKFQVGLPTPLGVLSAFGDPKVQEFCEPNYRLRMMEDLDEIAAKVPHSELAVQWDLPLEIAIWEGEVDTFLPNPREDTVAKLVEMMQRLPRDIEQGLHLCYGDISHRHWKEPDLAIMVEFVNAVSAKLGRPIGYVHFPIPRNWTEPEKYEKLSTLRLPAETKVFLGLVHQSDGVPGAKRRIEAASQYLPRFGVGTSCGLGRRKAADIPALFELHREIATTL